MREEHALIAKASDLSIPLPDAATLTPSGELQQRAGLYR
jgi:hypothetical protein